MSCRTGCTSGGHASWGECARAANLQVGPPERGQRQAWDAGLAKYRDARRQGLQPSASTGKAAEAMDRIAQATHGEVTSL